MRALIIHGGFTERELPGEKLDGMRRGLLDCVRHSWDFLASHSALETVVEAVRWLEDDPRFNAGTGSKLQADGRVRMSAALMDGSSRLFSGVVNVERVQNPILLAQRLQGETFTVSAALAITDQRARVANIVATDVLTGNGVIHVIDKVILPAP